MRAFLSTPVCRATFGTKPADTKVFINGKEIGTTPINGYKLPSNCDLEVRFVTPDGRELKKKIRLAPNMTSVFSIDLQ